MKKIGLIIIVLFPNLTYPSLKIVMKNQKAMGTLLKKRVTQKLHETPEYRLGQVLDQYGVRLEHLPVSWRNHFLAGILDPMKLLSGESTLFKKIDDGPLISNQSHPHFMNAFSNSSAFKETQEKIFWRSFNMKNPSMRHGFFSQLFEKQKIPFEHYRYDELYSKINSAIKLLKLKMDDETIWLHFFNYVMENPYTHEWSKTSTIIFSNIISKDFPIAKILQSSQFYLSKNIDLKNLEKLIDILFNKKPTPTEGLFKTISESASKNSIRQNLDTVLVAAWKRFKDQEKNLSSNKHLTQAHEVDMTIKRIESSFKKTIESSIQSALSCHNCDEVLNNDEVLNLIYKAADQNESFGNYIYSIIVHKID